MIASWKLPLIVSAIATSIVTGLLPRRRGEHARWDDGAEEVVVLVPLRQRFLDRWTCDTDRAHEQAQDRLVLALAILAKAGVDAIARIGDEDAMQAVEDTVGSYPATRVALVTAAGQPPRRRGQPAAFAPIGAVPPPWWRTHS